MSQAIREITQTATIAQDAAITGAVDIGWCDKGYIQIPAAWTAANIGFQVSADGTNYYILRTGSDANPVQITNVTTAAIRAFVIPSAVFSARYLKLWSKNTTAATETGVDQPAARTLTLYLKG